MGMREQSGSMQERGADLPGLGAGRGSGSTGVLSQVRVWGPLSCSIKGCLVKVQHFSTSIPWPLVSRALCRGH